MQCKLPENEVNRLAALQRYDILDSPLEDEFDRITRIVSRFLEVPIALVSLVDSDRQWFKSRQGLDTEQTSRDVSFCAHAILNPTPLIIPDALQDPRFSDNPLVTGEPHVRFYAGFPLKTADNYLIGSLCAIDHQPRSLTSDQIHVMQDLAAMVIAQMELRLLHNQASDQLSEKNRLLEQLHQSEQLAQQLAQTAQQANEAKSEFIARMSHELRTPLNAIVGFAQLLQFDDQLSQDNQESIDHILKAGHHLTALINEVLDIARIEAGHHQLSIAPVAVKALLKDCWQLIAPLAYKRHIRLADSTVDTSDPKVQADLQKLKQVILNLLSNAVKYNREGGTITLQYQQRDDDHLRISVSDTGMGVAADKLPCIFDPFERLGADQTTIEGSGIGLSISKALVEAMGGQLGVDSTLMQGSTFWMDLPMADPSTVIDNELRDEIQAVHLIDDILHTKRATIVYIEDNIANFRLIEKALAPLAQIKLIAAMTGHLGLELAQQHLPDIILLDSHLPDMRGLDVLAKLRQHPSTEQIPVAIVSADVTDGAIDNFIQNGADVFLHKPFDIYTLKKTIASLLN